MDDYHDITKHGFKKLPLVEMWRVVNQFGQIIDDRTYASFHITLYHLNGFFVEVWRRIGLNQIAWIEVIDDQYVLKRYYTDIDLGNL